MAEKTLLQIVQDRCRNIGLPVPTTVVANTDQTIQQMLGLINEEVEEHCNREYNFPRLKVSTTFAYTTNANYIAQDLSTVAGLRSVVTQTLWNQTLRLAVNGPISDAQWAMMIAMVVSSAIDNYRVLGSNLLIYPGHVASNTYSYDYMSYYGVLNAAGTVRKEAFTIDTDTPVMPSRIVGRGLEWRWRKAKGQPYAEEFEAYEQLLHEEANRESIPGIISMDNYGYDRRVAGPGLLIAAGSWSVP